MSAAAVEVTATAVRPVGRPLLAGWTCTTMVFGTVAGPAVGVLASTLIDRFDLTRADIGRLSALYALVGAAVSPFTGRLADRFGGKRMVIFTFLGGAVTFLLYSVAGSYALLLVAAAVSGVPNGSGNQATNRLIATRLSAAERGVVTGVKQSGVQLGRFLAGLALPSSVLAWGLGPSYRAMALLALAGAAATVFLLPADMPSAATRQATPTNRTPLPPAVLWLMLYALLLGAAAGATGSFTALFGEQELGMTKGQAGFMVGLTGGAAVISRIVLSGVAQRARHYGPALAWIALGASVSLAVTAMSGTLGVWALWLGTVGTAVTIGSWNSVAMLAAMASVPLDQAGRSSGRVMVGFLGGLGIAPPLFGAAIDRTENYALCWAWLTLTCVGAGAAMLCWWIRDRQREGPPVR